MHQAVAAWVVASSMVELATTAVNESVAQAERPVLEENRTGDWVLASYVRSLHLALDKQMRASMAPGFETPADKLREVLH